MELLEKIRDMIQPILDTHKVYLDDVEYIKEGNEWFLRVYVEMLEGNLDMDTCVAVSEGISALLDEKDPISGEYYLEVSSPGAEKQLKSFAQVQGAVGQYVYAQFINPTDGKDEVEGYIKSIENQTIYFEYLIKNIKKKMMVEYDNIKFIRLAVKF